MQLYPDKAQMMYERKMGEVTAKVNTAKQYAMKMEDIIEKYFDDEPSLMEYHYKLIRALEDIC